MRFFRGDSSVVLRLSALWLGLFLFLLISVPTVTKTSGLVSEALSIAWSAENKTIDSFQWPHEKSDLVPDPALKFGSFENGFRYVLMKNDEPKGRVSLHLNVQSGSLQERDNEQGLAHFLEHMLFNGSTHFPPGELIAYFQIIGMQLGPDANARTGFIDTVL